MSLFHRVINPRFSQCYRFTLSRWRRRRGDDFLNKRTSDSFFSRRETPRRTRMVTAIASLTRGENRREWNREARSPTQLSRKIRMTLTTVPLSDCINRTRLAGHRAANKKSRLLSGFSGWAAGGEQGVSWSTTKEKKKKSDRCSIEHSCSRAFEW